MIANFQMATEWCLTRMQYGKAAIRCLIKVRESTREAAAQEDTTGTESRRLQGVTEEGEIEVGTTTVTAMTGGGDGKG